MDLKNFIQFSKQFEILNFNKLLINDTNKAKP